MVVLRFLYILAQSNAWCVEATLDIFRQMDCIIDMVLSIPRVTI